MILQAVNVIGVCISLTGGMLYSYAKLKESGKLGGGGSKQGYAPVRQVEMTAPDDGDRVKGSGGGRDNPPTAQA